MKIKLQKIMWHLKYNGFTIIIRLILGFALELSFLVLSEINWYLNWLIPRVKPDLEYLKTCKYKEAK